MYFIILCEKQINLLITPNYLTLIMEQILKYYKVNLEQEKNKSKNKKSENVRFEIMKNYSAYQITSDHNFNNIKHA